MKLLITPLIESEFIILTPDGQEPAFRHFEGYCKTCVRSPQQFLQEYSYGSAVEIGLVALSGSPETDEAMVRDMRLRLSRDGVLIHVGRRCDVFFKSHERTVVTAEVDAVRLVYEMPKQVHISRGLRDFPPCDGSRWVRSVARQLDSLVNWTSAKTATIQADGVGLTSSGLPKSLVNRIDRLAQS